jgi:putative MATE family efflux protein
MLAKDSRKILGNQPLADPRILRQLIRLSIPAMIGLLVNTLYTMVDMLYVGQSVGPIGIAALGISLPAYVVLSAIALMIGVGGASLISRQLGAGKTLEANKTASTSVLGMLVIALMITVIGTIWFSTISSVLGATEGTKPLIRDYLGTLLRGAPIITMATVLNALLRAQGRAKQAMLANIIGNGINIILDPIMIITLGWGVRGAAIATILGQAAAALYALVFLTSSASSFSLFYRKRLFDFSIFAHIAAIGFPTLVRQLGTSAVTIVVNRTLGQLGGNLEIAAYGIIGMLLMFFNMPISGVVQGFQPLVGFHYGANRYDMIGKLLRYSLFTTCSIGVIFLSLAFIIPNILLGLFTKDQELINLAIPFTRIMMLGLPFLAMLSIGTAFFQSIGKAVPALVIWIARQGVLLIPLILVLVKIYGANGLFFAFPISDALSGLLVLLLATGQLRKWNSILS